MEKSILEKNLEQIARYDAALAESIASIKEYTHNLELRETTCGDLNLVVDGHPLHDEVDAVYEAEQIVAKTKYREESDTIHIIFGLGMGHLLQAFCKNSKGKIILYEPDIEILRAALEFVDLSSELSKSTVMLIDKEEKFEIAMGRLFFLKGEMTLSFLTSYVQLYPSVVSELKKKLVMLGSIYTNAYKELQRQSANWTVSVLNNLFRIYKNEELEALLGKFKDKPAVIVSAGPSLTENVEYIKQYRDNIVVFCVGTALKTLLKNGVRPDFVAMIESRYCLTQILDVDLSGINFIFYPSIFKGVYECDLDRVFNYYPDNMITTEWLENLSGIKADKYKSRGTVSICALESAYLLGCNPIILTGQDLAYRNGQCYASNSAYNIKYREVSPGKFELFVDDYDKYFGAAKLKDKNDSMKKLQETLEENSKNLCFVTGQNGERLLTSPAYAMFVEHFENIALEIAPYAKLFNTRSGGAQINGFENIKMQDFLEKYAAEKIDVEKIIDSSLRDYVSPKEFAKFKTTANTLLVSFEKCLNLFDKGEGEFKKLKNSYQRAKILTGEIRDRIGKISDIYSDIIREYVAKDRIFFSLLIREYYMMNEFLKEPNDYTDKEKMDELLDILQDFFSSGRQWLGLGIDFLKKQKELFDESSSSACK